MTTVVPYHRLLAAALLLCAAPAPAQELVRLASDEWCPYVCAQQGRVQGGYLVEVTSRALATAGVSVQPLLLPLNRAIRQALAGGLEGVYAPPEDSRLRTSSVLGYSRSCFYTLKTSDWQYTDVWSLKGERLGVIGDYEYDNGPLDAYIVANTDDRKAIDFSCGANAGMTNVKKLLSGRFPILLEHEQVMRRLLSQSGARHRVRSAGCLAQPFALRVGFSPTNPHSAYWIATLARGMKLLEKTGELEQIRVRYGIEAGDGPIKIAPSSLF